MLGSALVVRALEVRFCDRTRLLVKFSRVRLGLVRWVVRCWDAVEDRGGHLDRSGGEIVADY